MATLTDALVCEMCAYVLEKENYVNRKVNQYRRVIKFLHCLRNRARMIRKSFKLKTVTLQASALHNLQCLLTFIPWYDRYDGAFVIKKKRKTCTFIQVHSLCFLGATCGNREAHNMPKLNLSYSV